MTGRREVDYTQGEQRGDESWERGRTERGERIREKRKKKRKWRSRVKKQCTEKVTESGVPKSKQKDERERKERKDEIEEKGKKAEEERKQNWWGRREGTRRGLTVFVTGMLMGDRWFSLISSSFMVIRQKGKKTPTKMKCASNTPKGGKNYRNSLLFHDWISLCPFFWVT